MKCRSLILGALSLLAAHAAQANVLFDNVTGIATAGFSGPTDDGPTLTMGASFASAKPNFSSMGLLLAAESASTTGTTSIYLVADDGSSNTNGQSGLPTIEDNSGNFTSFAGAQLIGTVTDKSLTSNFSLVSFWVKPTIVTQDQEYWVVAQSSGNSSFAWALANDASGVGTAGQAYFNDYSGSNLLPAADDSGGYQLVVQTPEPAAIAILGGALVSFGIFRRKFGRNV